MLFSRRDIGKLALTAPLTGLLPAQVLAQRKPNSKWSGVQVGIIAPYAFQRTANTAQEILGSIVALGINAVELQSDPVEQYAGVPEMRRARPDAAAGPAGPGAAGAVGPGTPARPDAPADAGARRPGSRRELTPEQQAERRARAEELKQWRLGAPMATFAALRRMYNDAGVHIYGFKLALTEAMSDQEYDYAFNVAKALGAGQVTMEMPDSNGALTRRIGAAAGKHQMMVGYHQHEQATFTLWDEALSQSPHNGINLDVGHYVAGTSSSPIPLIEKHHARITSIHLKDRKKDRGANMPWGQGDTPIKDVLQLMKKERYTFPATIELEYRVEGSDPLTELKKCVQFCKDALN